MCTATFALSASAELVTKQLLAQFLGFVYVEFSESNIYMFTQLR